MDTQELKAAIDDMGPVCPTCGEGATVQAVTADRGGHDVWLACCENPHSFLGEEDDWRADVFFSFTPWFPHYEVRRKDSCDDCAEIAKLATKEINVWSDENAELKRKLELAKSFMRAKGIDVIDTHEYCIRPGCRGEQEIGGFCGPCSKSMQRKAATARDRLAAERMPPNTAGGGGGGAPPFKVVVTCKPTDYASDGVADLFADCTTSVRGGGGEMTAEEFDAEAERVARAGTRRFASGLQEAIAAEMRRPMPSDKWSNEVTAKLAERAAKRTRGVTHWDPEGSS